VRYRSASVRRFPCLAAAARSVSTPPSILALTEAAHGAAAGLSADALIAVRARVSVDGRLSGPLLQQEQHATHGLAWLATTVEAIRELAAYGRALEAQGRYGETEELLIAIGIGDIWPNLRGIPMSQGEFVRPADLGLGPAQIAARRTRAVEELIAGGNAAVGAPGHAGARKAGRRHNRRSGSRRNAGGDPAGNAEFAEAEVLPHAHGWHLANDYIPLAIVDKLAELGVFGLTLPEAYGGLGLGKVSMCVVFEELSRAYIGVGSLGTRSEIAAELILCRRHRRSRKTTGCRPSRRARCCRPPCSPSPIRVQTSARCAPARSATAKVDRITGNKTWITHAVARRHDDDAGAHRSRTSRATRACRCCCAESRAGTDDGALSRRKGLTGGEIEVLGYRGMKEYELGVRRLRGAGSRTCWRCRGSRLQAADGDLRVRPHPDRGARRRRARSPRSI
jgi:(2S)-methylsuccinyl-CoA dehydrogenase